MTDQNYQSLLLLPLGLGALWLHETFTTQAPATQLLLLPVAVALGSIMLLGWAAYLSPWARAKRKRLETLLEIPEELRKPSESSVLTGVDSDLDARIFLPDQIRTRHVHILGATGSGKTESVILNFLRQDISRGLGTIILDAKGDHSFLAEIERLVPTERLSVFDLSSADSLGYDPLSAGSAFESAQRLFSSLTWSEEYYKSKALSSLQRIFQIHFNVNGRNPTLVDVANYLETPKTYSTFVSTEDFPENLAVAEFQDL